MRWILITVMLVIAGCGGQATDQTETPSSPPAPATPLIVSGERRVAEADSVALAVMPAEGITLTSVHWVFDDPAIQLLAPTSRAIGFDAPGEGLYSFSVTAQDTASNTYFYTGELEVTKTPAAPVNVRLSHQAVELGRVSLRADILSLGANDSLQWQVIQGPAVALRYDEQAAAQHVYFQAPSVSADTLLEIKATVTRANGARDSDSAYVVIKDVPQAQNGFFAGNDLYPTDLIHPFRPGPYTEALNNCLYNSQVRRSCTFATLPLIGQVNNQPDIEQILARTLVSHDWMGEAFARFLRSSAAGPDIVQLLGATTGVVIAYDIRPSFYWSATGAIYLDANNLWQTPAERDTLDLAPDYRIAYGNTLAYRTSWRYIKDNAYYYPQPGTAPAERQPRSQPQVEAALSWLLYHELAHANDVFAPQRWQQLKPTDSPLTFANQNGYLSDALAASDGLHSVILKALAQVDFGGAMATAEQEAYRAWEVASMFNDEAGLTMYSFYTPREDFALLFERFMMKYRLGIDADVGFFDSPAQIADENTGALPIVWAQRNRFNAAHMQPRVAFAIENILPNIDIASAQNTFPTPVMLPANQDWFSTVSPTVGVAKMPSGSKASQKTLRVTISSPFEKTLPLPVNQ